MLENIYGNLFIDPDSFKDFDREPTLALIEQIARDIDKSTHVPDVGSVTIIASPYSYSGETELTPLVKGLVRKHVIYIYISHTDKVDKLIDWIDQFSHEYMHHAIDRQRMFSVPQTLWFDEALCHASSMVQASRIGSILRIRPDFVPFPKERLDDISEIITQLRRHGNSQVSQSLRDGKGLEGLLPAPLDSASLSLYGVSVASCIYHLFLMRHNLWKIVPHISEVPLGADVYELLEHLRATADDSYRHSLDELIKILFP